MEISGPQNNLRINDNPDNWDIKKEMDAINKPTPGWTNTEKITVPGSKGYLQFHNGPGIWEKRWKALRKAVRKLSLNQNYPADLFAAQFMELMTKITRKIK